MSTKSCPACSCTDLVLLRSLNKKICADCKTEFDWFLDPGQKPLQGPSRADRKTPDEIHQHKVSHA